MGASGGRRSGGGDGCGRPPEDSRREEFQVRSLGERKRGFWTGEELPCSQETPPVARPPAQHAPPAPSQPAPQVPEPPALSPPAAGSLPVAPPVPRAMLASLRPGEAPESRFEAPLRVPCPLRPAAQARSPAPSPDRGREPTCSPFRAARHVSSFAGPLL